MRILTALAIPLMLIGAVPERDSRNEKLKETDTAFFKDVDPDWPKGMTLAKWKTRRAALQRQILVAAGIHPLPVQRAKPRAEIFGKIAGDGYSIEKVLIETMPGYWLGGNLYRPLGRSGARPGVLSPHGHWRNGRTQQSEDGNIPARCVNLARQGFVVFAYDMVGYNDTKQTEHSFGGKAEEQLWRWGPMGLQLWNSIRAADFLQALPGVDPARLGMTGASGGGTQTFLLAAVDDRIKFSAPVNMISGIMQGGSPCENGPGLRIDTFNVEIGAMMAPRPMLMVSATGDWTKNTPQQEFPAIQKIYELYGKAASVENAHIDAKHNYNQASREAMYAFFNKQVLGVKEAPKEWPVSNIEKEQLVSLEGRELPAGALQPEGVFAQWKKQADKVTAGLSKVVLRQRLLTVLMAELPRGVEAEQDGDRIVLSRPLKRDRIPGRFVAGKGTPVLVVHPGGSEEALEQEEVKRLLGQGRPVLAIDVFQTGAAKASRDTGRNHLTFQRSDAAERVQDILTAGAWLSGKGQRFEMLGFEDGSVWTAVASALMPLPARLLRPPVDFKGSDAEWEKRCNVPGIQWAGGWKMIERLRGGAAMKRNPV